MTNIEINLLKKANTLYLSALQNNGHAKKINSKNFKIRRCILDDNSCIELEKGGGNVSEQPLSFLIERDNERYIEKIKINKVNGDYICSIVSTEDMRCHHSSDINFKINDNWTFLRVEHQTEGVGTDKVDAYYILVDSELPYLEDDIN